MLTCLLTCKLRVVGARANYETSLAIWPFKPPMTIITTVCRSRRRSIH